MKVLFDQGTPLPLRSILGNHQIDSAYERGWQSLTNGELIAEAELASYDVLITTDQNLRYQQNLANRKLAIVVLMTTSWPRIQTQVELIVSQLENLSPGQYVEISFM
jgi:hypothetical protein